jgi:hypothetical protein
MKWSRSKVAKAHAVFLMHTGVPRKSIYPSLKSIFIPEKLHDYIPKLRNKARFIGFGRNIGGVK